MVWVWSEINGEMIEVSRGWQGEKLLVSGVNPSSEKLVLSMKRDQRVFPSVSDAVKLHSVLLSHFSHENVQNKRMFYT